MITNAIIRRYRYGTPFETDAAVLDFPVSTGIPSPFKVLSSSSDYRFSCTIKDNDHVLGLGQAVGPQNRRGRVFENWCNDEPNHTPEVKSLYGAHPYLILDGDSPFLVWIDFPGHIRFDVGHGTRNRIEIVVSGTGFDMWIIDGVPMEGLVQVFRQIIGKPYIPPKWGLGYQQCRWSYIDENQVQEVAEQFDAHRLPLDAIYLDIDYMEHYKDFTIDNTAFPQIRSLIQKMRDRGLRLVPIIDAGVKIEAGYPVYEEGLKKGFFCTDENGKPFVAAVWPGRVHFPDFLNPEARRWFGEWYRVLIDLGFEGFWNDMNEPAIFYTDEGLDAAIDLAEKCRGKNLDVNSFFNLTHTFESINNRRADYQAMHHRVNGKRVSHDGVHNIYGMNMTRSAAEGFADYCPEKRMLMFSRASAIGAHRYGGIWTGDNHAWWEHLLLNVRMMPALNFCGYLYSGADTGGFSGDTSPELLIRWFQFSMFTPLFRNHAAMGTRRQEPYAYDEETVGILRNSLALRYAMIPWLYSEFLVASESDNPLFKPLSWSYRDGRSRDVDDQLLMGASLMLAPVVQPAVSGRLVWLPETMALWKASSYEKREWTVLQAGERYINLTLHETPVFLRPDAMLVMTKPAERVDALSVKHLDVTVFLKSVAEYTLHDDDGISLPLEKAKASKLQLKASVENGSIHLDAVETGWHRVETIHWCILLEDGTVKERDTVVEYNKPSE